LSLVDKAIKGTLRTVYISRKDRLCRFGFELVQHIFEKCGASIMVDEEDDKSPEQELTEDLVNIITVFSCKLQGKRQYKLKKEQQEAKKRKEEDSESDDRNTEESNKERQETERSKHSRSSNEDSDLSD
jgi:predicted site-specific integrase-resolvase